ncbi:diguanylate cyclase [Alteromonas genovensis]|uniref:diguanylate cyclase n=1 Tax=Alteromonas genovensis TaxID=471225 RepID=A0A6N9TAF2_9ALTE|nr:GGDEF domain-containing protein [Alteromonas genovensis]NDW14273.1 diguanylate cyclase [Alteromonas genovensis]
MDTTTLIVCTLLVSLVMTLTMAAMYFVNREERYLLDWMASGTFFLLSNIVAIFITFYQVPIQLSLALGNAFYIAGHATIFSGVYRCVYKRSVWRLVFGAIIAVILLHFIPGMTESVTTRIITFYPIIIALNVSTLIALFKHRPADIGRVYWGLMAVLFLFIMQLAVRGGITLFGSENLTLIGDQFMQTSGTLAVITFLFLLTICFTFIITWKKELKLRRASVTDYLTGWLNRKALDSIATREYERSAREKTHLGFVIIDIDHFKRINDKFGHCAGDAALKKVTQLAKEVIRGYDNNFRLGGEEFAVLISDTDEQEITEIAERIRLRILQSKINIDTSQITLTVSVGIALSTPLDSSWHDTLERADQALYEAKRQGRNRISSAAHMSIEPQSQLT